MVNIYKLKLTNLQQEILRLLFVNDVNANSTASKNGRISGKNVL